MSFISVPIGLGPPKNLWWQITNAPVPAGVPSLDLTTVTGITYIVRCNDTGYAASLTGFIQRATSTLLIAAYSFTGAEFPTLGYYVWRPVLTIPGGFEQCDTGVILVEPGT